MNFTIGMLVFAQLCYSIGDLLARIYMPKYGFGPAAFFAPWFVWYMVVRTFATLGQLYVFTVVDLGKTSALFGAISIILANILGMLVLKEVLTPSAYIGVSLTIIAFMVLAFR